MRDPNRIHRICQKLEQAWSTPGLDDMRMFQFCENYLTNPGTAWYQEDDKTEETLDALLAYLNDKR